MAKAFGTTLEATETWARGAAWARHLADRRRVLRNMMATGRERICSGMGCCTEDVATTVDRTLVAEAVAVLPFAGYRLIPSCLVPYADKLRVGRTRLLTTMTRAFKCAGADWPTR